MPDEKTSALEFTPEERAEADTSFPDPEQWNDGTHSTVEVEDAPEADEADDE
jgi:hypothetical protein